ncbi:MAG: S9 family peptidase [Gemmatimonadaceae bacterium]|nr:S9 family peptidase [Gemmatimonadaceae bacterium]
MHRRLTLAFALTLAAAPALSAQTPAPRAPRADTRNSDITMDSARARRLYVSDRFEDLEITPAQAASQVGAKKRSDSIYTARSAGVMEFRKVTYKSRIDGREVPAYLFAPLAKRGARGHAAMVWVHGGVHGDWGTAMFPFVREAVQRGYVVITPDYRGSTGYGRDHYRAIDYGGKEVDDAISAVDYLRTLPYVDMDRLGMMGWSHGGFITAHSLFRDEHPFKAGAAIVPVTNLFFRLSYKGPSYQDDFAAEENVRGLPFEKREEYIKRSPVFHVEKLRVPILVHVATNDEDVNFVEDQQMVHTLRSLKPDLAETKIYVNPDPWGASVGHAFSRRVDPVTLERVDSPAQIDSWNRTWTFFEWNLRPYEDRSKPLPPLRTGPSTGNVPPI